MARPLSLFIGLRYLSTGRGRGLVSFMSFASLAGIALGVAAVIVILSAMNGMEGEQRTRLLSMAQHVTVTAGADGADPAALQARLAAVDGVLSVAPFISVEAVLLNGRRFRGAVVRGIDPDSERGSSLADVVGADGLERLQPGTARVLLGRNLASDLGVLPGDPPIEILLPVVDGNRFDVRRSVAEPAGLFAAGNEQLDSELALMHLDDASRLAGLDGRAEGLSVRLHEPMSVGRVQRALEAAAGPGFVWSNWATENRSLYRAMRIEKAMMTILLMFIVAVAAFNIVTSLTMLVNEKAKDIAILRTLGYEPGGVSRIFLVQGGLLGLAGTLTGVGVGLVLAWQLERILPWLERTFGFTIMPGDVFYVGRVPSSIEWPDVLLIGAFAFLIALAATIVPSRRAARIEPAEVLRYE